MEYTKPKVTLLQQSGIGVAEYAGRTAYDSFDKSENESVRRKDLLGLNDLESSELLDQLAWVHHHHSVLEHVTLSYLVEDVGRGVLQEHARHRIQSITVRSTRYTMHDVLAAFLVSEWADDLSPMTAKGLFSRFTGGMLIFTDAYRARIETDYIYDALKYQLGLLGRDEFLQLALSKEGIACYKEGSMRLPAEDAFNVLRLAKKKRNAGDQFKHIVTDNWKVDMVVTFNLRSLKNYFDLRDSGAAWFQIQWLAQEMKRVTPEKYLRLIDKAHRP